MQRKGSAYQSAPCRLCTLSMCCVRGVLSIYSIIMILATRFCTRLRWVTVIFSMYSSAGVLWGNSGIIARTHRANCVNCCFFSGENSLPIVSSYPFTMSRQIARIVCMYSATSAIRETFSLGCVKAMCHLIHNSCRPLLLPHVDAALVLINFANA